MRPYTNRRRSRTPALIAKDIGKSSRCFESLAWARVNKRPFFGAAVARPAEVYPPQPVRPGRNSLTPGFRIEAKDSVQLLETPRPRFPENSSCYSLFR